MDHMIVHLTQKWFLVHAHINIQKTGLVGFEPTTAGLKGQCATWLRYRPRARYLYCIIQSLQISLKTGNFKIERFYRLIEPLQYSPVQNSALSRLRRVFKSRRGRHYFHLFHSYSDQYPNQTKKLCQNFLQEY